MIYTTKIKTADGSISDLAKGQYPPQHKHQGNRLCPECFVVNAWTEPSKELKET